MDICRLISNTFLFSTFSEADVAKIARFSSIKKLKSGEILFSQGEAAKAFYIVVVGRVKIFNSSKEGSEQTLHIHKSGDLVAEASIFDRITYPANCSALEDATLVSISGDEFIEMITGNKELSLKLLRSYSKRLRQFVSMVDDLSLRDIRGRLANHLLKHAIETDKRLIFRMNISKKELASLLGTVPETLSRNLKALKDDGLIEENEKEIEILDPKRLKDNIA